MSARPILTALAAISLAVIAMPAHAADTTPERLLNAAEGCRQNWLMVHRDYNNSPPLAAERHQPRQRQGPQAEVHLLDRRPRDRRNAARQGRSDPAGRRRLHVRERHLGPGHEVRRPQRDARRCRCGATTPRSSSPAPSAASRCTATRCSSRTNDMRMIAINKDSGEVAWEVNAAAPTDPATGTPSPKTQGFTGAPLAIKTKRRQGARAAGREHRRPARHPQLDRRLGRQHRPACLAHLHRSRRRASPARRPGRTTTMPGASAAAACGRPRPTIPPPTSLYYGTGDAFPSFDPRIPPGRQPVHGQHHRARRRHRQDRVVLPGDAERALGLRHAEPEDALRRQHQRRDTARSSPTSRATASTTRSTAPAASSCAPTSTRRRSPGRRASIRRPASRSTTIRPRTSSSMPASACMRAQARARRPARGGTARRPSSRRRSTPSAASPTWRAPRAASPRPPIKTPMDEKKDYVGLPPCCTEQGRITAHGALWAMDLKTGKIIGKATFQPPTESGMLSTDGGLLFTGHMTRQVRRL